MHSTLRLAPEAPIPPQPATIGPYRVTRLLGRGAMGAVYEAFDPEHGRRVAIKTLLSAGLEPAEIEEALARMRRESLAGQRLRHPNIVAVHAHGEHEGTWFMVMEYAEGEDLKRMLARGRLTLVDALEVMRQLLRALDYLHRRHLVHRDIKPSNLMIRPGPHVKVMDFGIARIDSSTLTRLGAALGTPTHMAPEQLMGLPVDARADLWAAGVILYELLTGVNPFAAATPAAAMHRVLQGKVAPPSTLDARVPPVFDAVLSQALARKLEERFQTAPQFHRAMLEAVNARL
jgi:serine/threonine-protein kinase